jgi:Methyltransferase domain
LPFADATFDVVVSMTVFHNVKPASERKKAVEEALRVLRPGGTLLIFDILYTPAYAAAAKSAGAQNVRLFDPALLWALPGWSLSAQKKLSLERTTEATNGGKTLIAKPNSAVNLTIPRPHRVEPLSDGERNSKLKGTTKVIFTAVTVVASIYLNDVAHAQCIHSNDAGRWNDPMDPAGRIADMCLRHYNDWPAKSGHMVIQNMNTNDCANAIPFARHEQSWNGDWFLWNDITCGNMRIFIK